MASAREASGGDVRSVRMALRATTFQSVTTSAPAAGGHARAARTRHAETRAWRRFTVFPHVWGAIAVHARARGADRGVWDWQAGGHAVAARSRRNGLAMAMRGVANSDG